MQRMIAAVGFWSGFAAFVATMSFVIVQVLQLLGVLRFPLDEILIYGTSLCIVIPFIFEVLALHYLTEPGRRFWTHAALVFTIVYASFVTANYVVQLATVIPAKLHGGYDAVRILDQTPHSMFWNFDAIGYIAMGLAMLVAVPALAAAGYERWVRRALLAHAAMTPVIAMVYFYPDYSIPLLLLASPWAITAPLAMLLLAIALKKREFLNAVEESTEHAHQDREEDFNDPAG